MSSEIEYQTHYVAPDFNEAEVDYSSISVADDGSIIFPESSYESINNNIMYVRGSGKPNNNWWDNRETIEGYLQYNKSNDYKFMENSGAKVSDKSYELKDMSEPGVANPLLVGLSGFLGPLGLWLAFKGIKRARNKDNKNLGGYAEIGAGGSMAAYGFGTTAFNLSKYSQAYVSPDSLTPMTRLEYTKGFHVSMGGLLLGAGAASLCSGFNDLFKKRKYRSNNESYTGTGIAKIGGGIAMSAGGVLNYQAGVSDWFTPDVVGDGGMGIYTISTENAAKINSFNALPENVRFDEMFSLGNIPWGVTLGCIGLGVTLIGGLWSYFKRRRNFKKSFAPPV